MSTTRALEQIVNGLNPVLSALSGSLLDAVVDPRFSLSWSFTNTSSLAAGSVTSGLGIKSADSVVRGFYGSGNDGNSGGGHSYLTLEDGPTRSIAGLRLASRSRTGAGEGLAILDLCLAPAREYDWRFIGIQGNPNLQVQAGNGQDGSTATGVNFQANVGSNRGLSVMTIGPFIYWDGAGANANLRVSSQNFSSAALGSVISRWTAPFAGSIIGISGRYEVANANTARVDVYKNGALAYVGANFTPSVSLKWFQQIPKNSIPGLQFNAGDDIYLQQIFSSPLNQWNTAWLVVEIDTTR